MECMGYIEYVECAETNEELVRKIQQREEVNRNFEKLIQKNIRLINKQSRQLANHRYQTNNFYEVRADILTDLYLCCLSYKEECGAKFSTYWGYKYKNAFYNRMVEKEGAGIWGKNYFLMHMRKQQWISQNNLVNWEELSAKEKITAIGYKDHPRNYSMLNAVEELEKFTFIPMDYKVQQKGRPTTIGELVEDKGELSAELKADLKNFYNMLPENEREVLKLKCCGYTQQKIAEATGVTQAEVSRRFIRAKNKFKEYTGSGKVEEKNVFPDPTNEDFISGLTEREKTILKLRSKGTTYKEISKRTGTSISYAQQTWKRIQGKYRIYLLEK